MIDYLTVALLLVPQGKSRVHMIDVPDSKTELKDSLRHNDVALQSVSCISVSMVTCRVSCVHLRAGRADRRVCHRITILFIISVMHLRCVLESV